MMRELLVLLGFLAVWVFLQAYLLPKLGVPTWMSDACAKGSRKESQKTKAEGQKTKAEVTDEHARLW